MGIEEGRVYYQHEPACEESDLSEPNSRGLRTCTNCAGMFDEDNKGVATTSKRFDENYVPPPKA